MIPLQLLKQKAERKYFPALKALLQGEALFPMKIPADRKLPDNYDDLLHGIGELVENSKEKKGFGYSLSFSEHMTRKHGLQSVPQRIAFDTPEDFFKFIGKKVEADKILSTGEILCTSFPPLDQWVRKSPRKLAKYLDEWEAVSRVLFYFRDNPCPRLYARELPIKVHTKFIEGHKAILRELLDQLIPDHIDSQADTFEGRFHLKTPELLIRLRRLDCSIDDSIFNLADDCALPSHVFKNLGSQCRNVIITENLLTFLTLPPLKHTLAVYGGGFRVENLKEALWLKGKTILYWGDIDAHGFLILSLVRRYFPDARSILMDEQTFTRFRGHCGSGVVPGESQQSRLHLTDAELVLYRKIREGNHRLEQEHLPRDYVEEQLRNTLANI
ncbi:MAG: hypothetical protein GY765_26660 [bacterium]|nr:hypothetical protein [bacterium]